MKRFYIADRLGRKSKFIGGGAFNTAVTYIVYLGLHLVIDYQWAYLVAYLLGIAFAYLFNARVVFRSALSWASALSFPFVYLIQYAVSAGVLFVLVEQLRFDERIAPLLVTIATLPLTYTLTRLVFAATAKGKKRRMSIAPPRPQDRVRDA